MKQHNTIALSLPPVISYNGTTNCFIVRIKPRTVIFRCEVDYSVVYTNEEEIRFYYNADNSSLVNAYEIAPLYSEENNRYRNLSVQTLSLSYTFSDPADPLKPYFFKNYLMKLIGEFDQNHSVIEDHKKKVDKDQSLPEDQKFADRVTEELVLMQKIEYSLAYDNKEDFLKYTTELNKLKSLEELK